MLGRLSTILLLVVVVGSASAERVTLEFEDAPIADILVAIGRAAGVAVVPDETVTGNASYYAREVESSEALAEAAARFDLFVTAHEGVRAVSAVRIGEDESGRLSVEAGAISPAHLLERLSRFTRTPVLFERLPPERLAYYCERLELSEILAQLALLLPEHELSSRSGAYLFSRRPAGSTRRASPEWISRGEHGFSIESEAASLPDLLRALFDAGDREYQLLVRGEPLVGPLSFRNRRFDELLTLVLERGGADYSLVEDVYYITEAAPGAAAARALVTDSVALERIATTSLLDLLPPEQLAGVTVRTDRTSEAVTLTGTAAEVARVRDLVVALDSERPPSDLRRMELSSVSPAELVAHLPPGLRTVQIVPLPRSTGITAYGSAAELDELERVVALVDRPEPAHLVTLRHVEVDELRAGLPAGVAASQIIRTTDPRRFYFSGTDAAYERLTRELALIDRPVPRLVYHILVVQHQAGEGLELDTHLGNALTAPDAVQAFVGSIGNLLSLDFDIVSSFGYRFAAQLDASVTESRATIVADATLQGLSGEPVSFRNTSTYRYRDVEVDAETGAARTTGVVREIASGLILEIAGSLSGELVTMDVATTVSRRGTDTAGSGNPPPTSEKVVRTRVSTEVGQPAVVAGLRIREDETSVRRTPLISRIPLLGALFQGRRDHADLTEIAVYLVPRLVRVQDDETELIELYERYYGGDE